MSMMYRLPFLPLLAATLPIISKSPNPPVEEQARGKFEDEHTKAGAKVQRVLTKLMPSIFRLCNRAFYSLEALAIVLQAYPQLRTYLPASVHILAPTTIRITRSFLVGVSFMLLSAFLRRSTNRTLGRYFHFELSVQKDHKLVTTGPYAYVRHPAYSGNFLYTTGLILTQMGAGSWWAEGHIWDSEVGKMLGRAWLGFLGVMWVAMVHRVLQEDKVLRKEFKDEWVAYAKRVPYRLFPWLF